MVNSNLNNNNALADSVAASSICHKQPTLPMKKVALRDVQNDIRSFSPTYPENYFLGRLVENPSKVLAPEIPQSPHCYQFTSFSGASNHLMRGGVARKLDSELGKRRVEDLTKENTGCLSVKRSSSQKQPDLPKERTKEECRTSNLPAFAPMSSVSPVKFSPGKPPFPVFLGKPTNELSDAHASPLRFTPGYVIPHIVESERNHKEQRAEQFLHLQNLLQYFDESDNRDYIEMLRALPSFELSRHAVELEKRSMQLSVEEAKEIERMKALNMLGKS